VLCRNAAPRGGVGGLAAAPSARLARYVQGSSGDLSTCVGVAPKQVHTLAGEPVAARMVTADVGRWGSLFRLPAA